ncbi:MAG: hypothetical protein EBQ85_01380 [Proteobacteria bacterium]|nr:hypothetical protein [Pseudomonadota bacterium]
MKLFPLNQTGSALVLGVMAGLVGVMGSVGAALLLKSYLRQNSQTGQAVQASGSDLVGLDYLSGKFKFKKSGDGSRVIGKPSWFIDPYPSAQTLIQSSVQPGPGIIKIPGRVVAFDVASATQELVPKWSIPGVKKGMKCLPLDKPEISFAKKLPTEACAPDKNHPILEYVIDEGNLDSVEKNSGTTAFVNTKNLMKMSQDKTVLKSLLNGGGVPVQVESMAAGAVQFRALHAHKRYPQALGTVEVQMGNTIAEIPVELPPNPKCQIRLLSPIPRQVGIDPSFEPGTDVLFALSTDSIALSAQSSADGGVHIQTVNVSSQQSVGNFGRFQQIATFSLKAPDRPLPILRRSDTTVAWFPKVFVQGVTGNATSNCTLEVPVHAPPPPICTLSPENAQILRGQSTNMILDCTNPNGGAVVSATIAGQAVPANFPITKKAQLPYTRTEVRNKEKIVAVVQGILDTIEVVAWLGEVCPFNDPNYSAQLLKARQWLNIRNIVTEEKDLVTPFKNADPLFFTRSPTAKVVSMSSLEVPLEFITEGVSLTKDPGLKRFGIEPRGGGINCRWTVEFDPTNANLTRYNL